MPYLLLFGITLLYFHRVLPSRQIFVERDLSAFFIPPRFLWVDLVKSGTVPLWNPYNYSGIPLLATLQPAVFYPPHLLYLFLPFNVAWNWLILLHFFFAGTTTYGFLRYLKVGKEASFCGAVTFMLSGYLLSVHNLLPHLFSVSWFPLVLICALKYFERGRAWPVVGAALCLTMQLLGGAPEIVIMTVIVLFILLFVPGVFISSPLGLMSRFKGLGLTLLCFLLFSSVQLVPFLELSFHSIRRSGLNYEEATTWSFAWRDFILFFLPDAFGYFQNDIKYWANQSWLKTLYLGIPPFLIAAFFFVTSDRRRFFFLSMIVLSFLLALGHNTPLYGLLYRIPPMSSVRFPVKFLFLFYMMAAIVVGLGMERLKRFSLDKDSNIRRTILAFFYMGFVFALAWGFVNLFGEDLRGFLDSAGIKPDRYNEISSNIHNLNRLLFFGFIFCLALLVYLRTRGRNAVLLVLIGLVTSDLFLANYGYYNSSSWEFYLSRHPFVSDLSSKGGTGRYLVTPKTKDTMEFRHFPSDRMLLTPAYAALFGLYSVDGTEVLRIDHYDKFLGILSNTSSIKEAKKFMSISGVNHVIAAYRIEDKDFRGVGETTVDGKPVYLHEYLGKPVRLGLFNRITGVSDEKEMVARLRDDKTDLERELLLFASDRPRVVKGSQEAAGAARFLSYRPNSVSIAYEAADDGYLFLSDTYYPGWRAYLDGKETKIYRANLAFRAVEAPAGRHRVLFRYVPISFYLGLSLTLVGIALALFLVIRDRRKGMGKSATGYTRGHSLLEGFLAKQRARKAWNLIRGSAGRQTILDIGCGTYPYFLTGVPFVEKHGMDQAADEAVLGPLQARNIFIRQSNYHGGGTLPYEEGYFDVVTMLAVLEHIEPASVPGLLKEVHRVLRPGGLFVLTTPAPWTDRLLLGMARLRLVSPAEIEEHKAAYDSSMVIDLLETAGFSRERSRSGYFEAGANVWARAVR